MAGAGLRTDRKVLRELDSAGPGHVPPSAERAMYNLSISVRDWIADLIPGYQIEKAMGNRDQPIVSCIIIFYNAELFIQEGIDSISPKPILIGNCCLSTTARSTAVQRSHAVVPECPPKKSESWNTRDMAIAA